MPNTTKGFPYPNNTDPVAQTAAAVQALATAVDVRAGASQRGTTTIALAATGAGSNTIALDNAIFGGATPSLVQVTAQSNAYFGYCSARAGNSITVGCRHFDNTAATASITVHWVAYV